MELAVSETSSVSSLSVTTVSDSAAADATHVSTGKLMGSCPKGL